MEENRAAVRGKDIIVGRNAIIETLEAGRTIDSIYAARGNHTGSIGGVIVKAKQSGIPVEDANPKKLNYPYGHTDHQGMVTVATVEEYAPLEDLFRVMEERGEPPFFLTTNELGDSCSLRTILRTIERSEAHGMIAPRRHAAGPTFTVGKASAGTMGYVSVARVANLPSTLEELGRRGVWIYVAGTGGQGRYGVNRRGLTTIVIGSEGLGVSRLVRERSDSIVSSLTLGKIDSLNVSVVCDVICCEVIWRRKGIQAR